MGVRSTGALGTHPADDPDNLRRTQLTLYTSTSLSTFRTCPRKYEYRYVQRLKRVRTDDAMRFGSAYHLGMEMLNTGIDIAEVLKLLELRYEFAPDWADQQAWLTEMHTVTTLVAGYARRGRDWHKTIIEVEKSFAVPMRRPNGRKFRNAELAGKMDGLATMDNRPVVLEYKTAGEDISPESDYWLRLRSDQQLSIYVIAARELGHDVSAAVYEVARKPTIRLRQTETPQEYAARLSADIEERPDYYYQAREVPRLDDELDAARTDVAQEVLAIRNAEKSKAFYRNVGRMTCTYCEFSHICLQGQYIEPGTCPAGFEIQVTAHPELEATQ